IDINRELESEEPDVNRVRHFLDEAKARSLNVFDADLAYLIARRMDKLMEKLSQEPANLELLERTAGIAEVIRPLPLTTNLWRVQHVFWNMLQSIMPDFRNQAQNGDHAAREWLKHFHKLGEELGFAPHLVEIPPETEHHEPEPELAVANA